MLARGEAVRFSREVEKLAEDLTRLTVQVAERLVGELRDTAARTALLADRDRIAPALLRAQDQA